MGVSGSPTILRKGAAHSTTSMIGATFEDDTYLSNNHYRGDYVDALGVIDSALSVDRNTLFDVRSTAVVFKVDYENPITDSFSLSGGLKSEVNWVDRNTQVTDLDRSTGEGTIDPLRSNHYLPEETTYASYGNVSYRLLEKLSLQFGLRLEYALISATYISGEPVVDNAYPNLFPSGSATYSFSDEESLTLSYRRSVSLPDIESLNPLRVRWSEFWESAGNPDLLPKIIHSINLNYTMFWGEGNMWSVAPSFPQQKTTFRAAKKSTMVLRHRHRQTSTAQIVLRRQPP